MSRLLLLLTAVLLPGLAFAESALVWEHRQVELRLTLGEKQGSANFEFTNASQHSVVIDSVKSSCGCTTVAMEKKNYAPGEKGRITAVFTVGKSHGLNSKGIQVKVHGEPDPTILILIARIPEAVKIEPPLVWWGASDKPQPKTIRLTVSPEVGGRLLKVSSNNPAIGATLETVKEGREYTIVVTPSAMDKPAFAVLTIDASFASKGQSPVLQAYAKVIGPRPPPR